MVTFSVVGLVAAVVMGFGAVVNGAVIFEDNFSDEGLSDKAWSVSNDFIQKSFSNGECVVANTSNSHSGFVYHALPSKPAVFTVSTKITRSAATTVSGLAVGFNTATDSCILFVLYENSIGFGKLGVILNSKATPYINATVNTLTVSMNGSVCNVFVNNNFVTTFKYNSIPGGDIAYVVFPGATSYFDDFVMTNEYIETPLDRTVYADDFENGLKKDWTVYPKYGTATVDSGKLKLKTENKDSAYVNMSVDVSLTDFIGKAAFTHKTGNPNKIYGLLLEGDSPNEQATFAISANSTYGAVVGNDTFSLAPKQSIKGKVYVSGTGAVTYYTDTLEIIKRAGSNQYVFFANGDTLTSLTGINFAITKVGIFCQDSLDLTVDDFSFKPFPVAVKRPFITNRSPLKANQSAYRGLFVFDPLGRSVIANRVLGNKASSGVYFAKSQQKSQMMMIVKNQK